MIRLPIARVLYGDTEPHKSIAATMDRFRFTRPVEQADLDHVRQALLEVAPGCSVVVRQSWPGFVRVEVVDAGGLPVFGREYIAV